MNEPGLFDCFLVSEYTNDDKDQDGYNKKEEEAQSCHEASTFCKKKSSSSLVDIKEPADVD